MSEWDPIEEIPIHIEQSELVERSERTLDEQYMSLMRDGTVINSRPIMIDAMSRQIHPGDIINWRSGGYFGHFLCFGLVTRIDEDKGFIQLINHNGNRVTIWRTHMCVILASEGDYSAIPEDYLKIWFKE